MYGIYCGVTSNVNHDLVILMLVQNIHKYFTLLVKSILSIFSFGLDNLA